jgi:hypothetical protein
MLRARMIVSMEKLFREKDLQERTEFFPRYCFVLIPLGGDGQMNASKDQWNGVLNALKSEIRELRDRLGEQSERQEHVRVQQERGSSSLKNDICERQDNSLLKMEERMKRSIREVEGRVVGIEGRLAAIEENLLTILREIKR